MSQSQQHKNTYYTGLLWDEPSPPSTEEYTARIPIIEKVPKAISKINTSEALLRLNSVAKTACAHFERKRPHNQHILVSFYPYVGLKSTIRFERQAIKIRISDILHDAPDEVLYALIQILLARATHQLPAPEFLHVYNTYIGNPEIEQRHADLRKKKTRKQLIGPKGRYYNLDDVFEQVNQTYFDQQIHKPTLSWSPKKSRTTLGYHDKHLNLVVISRLLDGKKVPPFVVDFIMYHELLHIVIPTFVRNGKRMVHTREFRQREQAFHHYHEANYWIKSR
jgi:hypothetical protein